MNIGPMHLVSISSEYYYYTEYGWEQIIRQYEWLERDLIVSITASSTSPLYHSFVQYLQIGWWQRRVDDCHMSLIIKNHGPKSKQECI